MRCLACNSELSDFESTRKYIQSGLYVDLCNHCFSTVEDDINVIEREDLRSTYDDSETYGDLDGTT